uniref:Uncharacterized protein n=1 Tax=Trichuris muris TaxID=70415 RepID=A0A5S6QC94_TRIMR
MDRGTVTRILSNQAVEVDGVPRHVRDVRKQASSDEVQGNPSGEDNGNELVVYLPAHPVDDGAESVPGPPAAQLQELRRSTRLISEVAREDTMERLLRQVYDLLECIYDAAFLSQTDCLEAKMTNVFNLLSSVRQILATSSASDNFPDCLAQAAYDVETVLTSAAKVSCIIHAAVVLKNACAAQSFTVGVAEFDVPHMWISPSESPLRPNIAKILPGFDVVTYGNVVCMRVCICATDGKVYTYMLLENESLKNVRSKCRLVQCFHGLNKLLREERDSVSRNLHFELPEVIPLGPHHTLILSNMQTKSMLSLFSEVPVHIVWLMGEGRVHGRRKHRFAAVVQVCRKSFQRVNRSVDEFVISYYE